MRAATTTDPDGSVVLLVDDDGDLRSCVCELLEEDGHQVVCCEEGLSALNYLRSGKARPQVILLDLMMPRMNGYEFREEQLRDQSLAKIPVVVMTAGGALTKHPAEVDEILLKPILLDQLLEIVGRYGSAHHAQDKQS